MDNGPFTASNIERIASPLMENQRTIAADLATEYDRSDGDLELLQEREYERGRAEGQAELAALIRTAFLIGIDAL